MRSYYITWCDEVLFAHTHQPHLSLSQFDSIQNDAIAKHTDVYSTLCKYNNNTHLDESASVAKTNCVPMRLVVELVLAMVLMLLLMTMMMLLLAKI